MCFASKRDEAIVDAHDLERGHWALRLLVTFAIERAQSGAARGR